ncbi:hypothetical protein ACLOJK_006529, partial [Asimina triloba]
MGKHSSIFKFKPSNCKQGTFTWAPSSALQGSNDCSTTFSSTESNKQPTQFTWAEIKEGRASHGATSKIHSPSPLQHQPNKQA